MIIKSFGIKLKQSSTTFPPKIKELGGKEIKLKIQICDDNIQSGSRLYYAIDAYDSSSSNSGMSEGTVSGYKSASFDSVST